MDTTFNFFNFVLKLFTNHAFIHIKRHIKPKIMNTYFFATLVAVVILALPFVITSWGYVKVPIKSENK